MKLLRAIGRATIWHRDAIPEHEGEIAREVKRYLLPLLDVALILGAFFGVRGGMPTLAAVYSDTVSFTGAAAVLVFAVGCLIGVAFPSLWLLELVSKCGLGFVLATYGVLLMVAAAGDAPARGIVAGACIGVAGVVVWRIFWLSREYRRRRRSRASVTS